MTARRFVQVVGDGHNSLAEIEHPLATLHPLVQVYDTKTSETISPTITVVSPHVVRVEHKWMEIDVETGDALTVELPIPKAGWRVVLVG